MNVLCSKDGGHRTKREFDRENMTEFSIKGIKCLRKENQRLEAETLRQGQLDCSTLDSFPFLRKPKQAISINPLCLLPAVQFETSTAEKKKKSVSLDVAQNEHEMLNKQKHICFKEKRVMMEK